MSCSNQSWKRVCDQDWNEFKRRGKKESAIAWFFHAFGHFPLVLRIGTAAADLPLCCDIQRCNSAFALLELPNPTRTAMAFKTNVGSRRNRAASPVPRIVLASPTPLPAPRSRFPAPRGRSAPPKHRPSSLSSFVLGVCGELLSAVSAVSCSRFWTVPLLEEVFRTRSISFQRSFSRSSPGSRFNLAA
jgi:hypothetical protein